MAIIDRPKAEDEAEIPKPASGIIQRPKAEVTTQVADDHYRQAEPQPAASGVSFFAWFKWLFLIILLAGATVLTYQYLQKLSFEDDIKSENITLEVDRLIRIDSIITLLEKKIEQNQGLLQRSEKLGDKVLVDTMRLALAQNLIDIEKHQDSYIGALVDLNKSYQAGPDSVVQALKNQLKSSSDSYKLGRVGTIKEILELMESIPKDKTPKVYFSEKIKKQK